MSKEYEDMSKEELITLVKRLGKSHNEWRRLAVGYAKVMKSTNLPPEMIDDTDKCTQCGKEIEVPEGEVWSDGCWVCYLEQEPDWREGDDE